MRKDEKVLTIFVLCYNRMEMAKQAIKSISQQLSDNVKLVVSDNSTSEGLLALLEAETISGFSYVKRTPSLPVAEHINACFSEVTTPYSMLFHDDDLLSQGAVEIILQVIDRNVGFAAFGLNALVERNKIVGGKSFLSLKSEFEIRSPAELVGQYFGKYNFGIAPFPGYVYSKHASDKFRFSESEGKYSDVAWLMRICSVGPILWLAEPLMTYRIHATNDSNFESRKDRLRFLAFLKKHTSWVAPETLEDYRYFIYKRLARKDRSSVKKIISHLKSRRFFRLSNIGGIFKKINFRLRGDRKGL